MYFNTKILKSFWIYESTESNGVQKQIYKNLHVLHYRRKAHDISNKVKRRLMEYATTASPEHRDKERPRQVI